jgi:hypothetical protein
LSLREIRHVANERVERGAALGLVNPSDRLAVRRIGGKAVDCFSRQTDEVASLKACDSGGEISHFIADDPPARARVDGWESA